MLINIIAGLLGVVFQTFAKMRTLSDTFKAANQEFVVAKFFKKERWALAGSISFIAIMAITLPEILILRPALEPYVRLMFTFGGAIGSYCFSYFLGKSTKYITNIIDKKTNIADGKDQQDDGTGKQDGG